MASAFDIFNRVLTVQKVGGAASGHFNSSDIYQAPVQTTTTIQGHISMVNIQARESQYRQSAEGPIEAGNPRLFTESVLEKGDIVTLDQGGGVTYRYRVIGLVRANRFIAQTLGAPVRFEYDLAEIPR